MIGDFTERMLRAVGVTPERYCEAKRLFGFYPECRCEDRKEWLNNISRWWSEEKPKS